MKYGIICDSSADLTPEQAASRGITVVPFYVSVNGESYLREGVDITPAQLYQQLRDHGEYFPRTSMPTIADYAQAFEKVLGQGLAVVCICLTQKFSGSYQAALSARNLIRGENPEAEIYVVDSQLVTALQGLLVLEAARLRDLDLEPEKAVALLEGVRSTGHIFFTTKDLKYLHHGGRLSSARYVAGSMLDIKPVLHFHQGDLTQEGICRGQKRSLHKIVEGMVNYLKEQNLDVSQYVFGTGLGLDFDGYEAFVEELKARMEENGLQPAGWINIRIGATIGVHTGPYPVGLGFLKQCNI